MFIRSLAILLATIPMSSCVTTNGEDAKNQTSTDSKVVITTKFESDPPEDIYGFLKYPEGNGPFPVVVLMAGCSGMINQVDRQAMGG